MSAPMKMLFDRFSDLLRHEREGRALAGKEIYLLANGAENELPIGFEVPFHRTADYLRMRYAGCCYVYTGRNADLRQKTRQDLEVFSSNVFGATAV